MSTTGRHKDTVSHEHTETYSDRIEEDEMSFY